MSLIAEQDYLQDEALAQCSPRIRHGFFTRKGGVSEGIYASLNAGAGSDDDPQSVIANKALVAEAMGVDAEKLLTLYQIHSDRVLTVNVPFAGDKPEADGMATSTKGLALGILTADCGPVLFADGEAEVIGACHAGWKGAFSDIMIRTVEAMESLGADREKIIASIGPCIGQESYEVDAGFRTRFMEKEVDHERFFIPSEVKQNHFHFDLGGFIAERLKKAGVGSVNLLAKDTCYLENDFFSFRRKTLRGEADYGRQISVIALASEHT